MRIGTTMKNKYWIVSKEPYLIDRVEVLKDESM